MSKRWAFTNKSPAGIIDRIYCVADPSLQYPTGRWMVHFRDGRQSSYLDSLRADEFYYYEDKNAYREAMVNAAELGRTTVGLGKSDNCCAIM